MKGQQMNDDLGYNGFNVSLFYLAPIQYEEISDPNVAIALKNITKKNAVTKEKRLGEFLRLLETKAFNILDYYVLVCWIQSYPRLALDSSKPVRQLSHQIQGTYMEMYGAKEFSPFLKSSLPVWLQGLYDDKSIANSVKASLLKNFTNDETKVNHKIWVVFHEQIVNFCHHVIVQQSAKTISDERSDQADELNMKYERAMVSAVSMLTKILALANGEDNFLSEPSLAQIEEILKSEKLWDYLGSFSSESNLNLSLFKSLLALIAEVFALDSKQNLKSATLHLSDLKGIYKTISKKFIKLVKVPDSTESSAAVIYSSVVVQLINVLNILTKVTSGTNSVDKKRWKLKKNFWQIGGSKSGSRLNEYIKLGPCNSDPIYYKVLAELLVSLKESDVRPDEDFKFLDFSSAKDASKIIVKCLLPQFSKFLGPKSFRFKEEATKCITVVYGLFADQVDLHSAGIDYTIFLTILDGVSSTRIRSEDEASVSACIKNLAEFATHNTFDKKEVCKKLIQSTNNKIEGERFSVQLKNPKSQILCSYHSVLSDIDEASANDFLSIVFEALEETYDPESLSMLVLCLVNVLKTSKSGERRILDWAVELLPSYITKDFVDLSISMIECVFQRSESRDLKEFFGDCFTKVSNESPSKLPELICLAIKHNILDTKDIENNNPDVYEYLSALAKRSERSSTENELINYFVNDRHILESIVTPSLTKSDKLKLVSTLVSRGDTLDGAAVGEFIQLAVSSCDETCRKFLGLIEDKSMVQIALFDYISTSSLVTDFSNQASFVIDSENKLLFSKIEEILTEAFEHADLSSLAIANALGQNIYLFDFPSEVKRYPEVLPILSFMNVFLKSEGSKDTRHLIWRAKAYEYSEDFAFLCDIGNDELANLTQTNYEGIVSRSIDDSTVTEIFNGVTEDSFYKELVADLNGKGAFSPSQFYSARALVRIMSNTFENMTLTSFDKLEIQYTKLAGSPLRLATFLCCASKFVGHSSKFDRVRNYVFGEILGVHSVSSILTSGMTWVAIATNFVKNAYDILPSHKLAMVINQISSWLDSEIAYDEAFERMRVLLSQFLTHIISFIPDQLPDKTWELSADLCLNNLSTAQVNPRLDALKYFTLKLFVVLSKSVNEAVYTQWAETKVSLYQEIFELLFQEQTTINQPAHLVNQVLERVLNSVDISEKFLSENADRLYNLLSTSNVGSFQRTAASLLSKHIYAHQQDVIVDYQFRTKKTEEDEMGEIDELVKLPASLLEAIRDLEHHLDDYLYHEKFAECFRYLWSWMLIFTHFESSTISMKSAYVDQIKKGNAIEKLLGTIFDCIDLADSKFINSLLVKPIEKNAKVTPENCLIQNYSISEGFGGHSAKEEVLFLLTHLYYLSFTYLGTFAQQWFQELRDLQLKQQIEKFSVNFISPILISKMLDDVEKTKGKLIQGDDNLTIKINRVTNEIKSSYLIDEQNMEMIVKIPEAFPLSKVSVEGPLRLGVKENQWKAWLMASQRVVSLTNGSITDCIELFNKNVTLHFSGFEECAICYSILHQDHSLPSKTCPTCSNKFHSACLYKWFKTSGSSTCPLCRSTFNFRAGKS